MTGDEGYLRLLLGRLAAGEVMEADEAERLFGLIMAGQVSPVRLASILTALRARGETSAELLGAVTAVRQCMTALPSAPDGAIDVCGTGGDGLGTLNVSTAVAFVLAGLGIPVAKHGNRALSSRSGALDTLMTLGISSSDDLIELSSWLHEDNVAFLAAPVLHPAMRYASEVRRELGFRTLFNLIGPMCNPARVRRQLIGVYDPGWLDAVAGTLGELGSETVWVVHGDTDRGGTDEITLAGKAYISAWEQGGLHHHTITPEMASFERVSIGEIVGGDATHNAQVMHDMLLGASGPYRDTVIFNAAVAMHVAGYHSILSGERIDHERLRHNVRIAASAIDTGAAFSALERARQRTRRSENGASPATLLQKSG